ncbi:MAG: DUF4175 family protein, partial [Pseudomonadota bacterium]
MSAPAHHRGLSAAAARRLPWVGAILYLERALGAELGWVMAAWGGFAALGLLDMGAWLPGEVRLALLAALIVGSVAALVRFVVRAPLPERGQMLARLDAGAALPFGTTSFTDAEPVGTDSPLARDLWRRARRDAMAKPPRLALPRPKLSRWLKAVAIGVAVFLAVGAIAANRALPERLAAGFSPWTVPVDAYAARLDIEPPDYSAAAPTRIELAGGTRTEVPALAGSHVTMQSEDAAFRLIGPAGTTLSGDRFAATKSGRWRIDRHGRTIASFDLSVVADGAPDIRIEGAPVATASGALRLTYRLTDDHGLSALFLVAEGGDAPAREWPLSDAAAPGTGQVFADLTADARAGEDAILTMIARDGAGNVGRSSPLIVELPVRTFTDDVAREIVGIRKSLLSGAPLREAVRRLTEIAGNPELFDERLDTFSGLRAATWRLLRNRNDAGRRETAEILWDTAVDLEDGGTSRALDDFRTALERLMQEAGSGDDRTLSLLTQQLEQALAEYLSRQIAAALAKGE